MLIHNQYIINSIKKEMHNKVVKPLELAQETVEEAPVETVLEEITDGTDLTKKQEKQIAKDIEALADSDIPVESIESVEVQTDNVYNLKVSNAIADEIKIDNEENGAIEMNVTEGDINNSFRVEENGDVYIDGEKLIFESTTDEDTEQNDTELSTGGWSWSTKKPSKIKSYENLSKLNWSCKNVTLSNIISKIAVTVITAALTKTNPNVGLGMGITTDIISEFKKSDPYSRGLSYKVYIGYAVSPKDNRYCKSGTIYYSQTNYKGLSKTKYLYGTMM